MGKIIFSFKVGNQSKIGKFEHTLLLGGKMQRVALLPRLYRRKFQSCTSRDVYYDYACFSQHNRVK